jgi:hypothetical protein
MLSDTVGIIGAAILEQVVLQMQANRKKNSKKMNKIYVRMCATAGKCVNDRRKKRLKINEK